MDPNSSSSKDALLEEACKKYAEATRLCPTLYDVSSYLLHCLIRRIRIYSIFSAFRPCKNEIKKKRNHNFQLVCEKQ